MFVLTNFQQYDGSEIKCICCHNDGNTYCQSVSDHPDAIFDICQMAFVKKPEYLSNEDELFIEVDKRTDIYIGEFTLLKDIAIRHQEETLDGIDELVELFWESVVQFNRTVETEQYEELVFFIPRNKLIHVNAF